VKVAIIPALGLGVALTLSAARSTTSGQPEWTLREDMRLGAAAGPEDDLPPIGRVVVGRDGTVFALGTAGEIIVFDRAGSILRRVRGLRDSVIQASTRELMDSAIARLDSTVRRQQIGVSSVFTLGGVSRAAPAMGLIGDTLWVITERAGRVTLFGRQGDVVGTIPYTRNVVGGLADTPLALLADRSLLRTITPPVLPQNRPDPPMPPPPGQYRMPVIPAPPVPEADREARGFLLRASPGGVVVQGLEIFIESRASFTVPNQYGETARLPHPFGDAPLVAVTPDGSEIVFVERYSAARAGPASFLVARFDVRTGKRTARRHEYLASPIQPASVDSIVSRMVDSANTPLARWFYYGFPSPGAAKATVRAALDVPSYHVPVTEVVAGADRTVWLREQTSGRWSAYGADGEVAGRIAIPPGARFLYADDRAIWVGVELPRGQPGARVLVRYRLERP
jgi:hypothetical protein